MGGGGTEPEREGERGISERSGRVAAHLESMNVEMLLPVCVRAMSRRVGGGGGGGGGGERERERETYRPRFLTQPASF